MKPLKTVKSKTRLAKLSILISFCVSCETRTSSETRFEENIGFALPTDKEVLKDEFHDMLQDYAIIYEVKLSRTSNQELTKKIRSLIDTRVKECNWSLIENGFDYLCEKEQTLYRVTYDTMNRVLTYEELAD